MFKNSSEKNDFLVRFVSRQNEHKAKKKKYIPNSPDSSKLPCSANGGKMSEKKDKSAAPKSLWLQL
jgi:hypothetical protein